VIATVLVVPNFNQNEQPGNGTYEVQTSSLQRPEKTHYWWSHQQNTNTSMKYSTNP